MGQKSKGILYIILSAFCFALMNVFVRLSGDLPSIEKSFFRNLVALAFAAVVLLRTEEKFRFQRKNLGLLTLRSLFGTIGILGNYYALDHMLLADATMLGKLAPFFAILFSFFLLREKVTPFQIGAILVAFGGSLLIIKPDFSGFFANFGPIAGIVGSMGAGLAYTLVRKLRMGGERGPIIVFFFSAFSCLVTLPYLIFHFHPMELWQLFALLGAGLAAAGGQFSVTAAYACAPAKEISVFDYTQILFAAVFGVLFFGQLPDRYSVLGYGIICGVSVLMFLWQKKGKYGENIQKG